MSRQVDQLAAPHPPARATMSSTSCCSSSPSPASPPWSRLRWPGRCCRRGCCCGSSRPRAWMAGRWWPVRPAGGWAPSPATGTRAAGWSIGPGPGPATRSSSAGISSWRRRGDAAAALAWVTPVSGARCLALAAHVRGLPEPPCTSCWPGCLGSGSTGWWRPPTGPRGRRHDRRQALSSLRHGQAGRRVLPAPPRPGCRPTASPAPAPPRARPRAAARTPRRPRCCGRSTGSASAAGGPWAATAVEAGDGPASAAPPGPRWGAGRPGRGHGPGGAGRPPRHGIPRPGRRRPAGHHRAHAGPLPRRPPGRRG